MPFVSSYGNYYPEWTVQFVLGLLQYSPTEHKGKIGVYYHWLATRQPVTGVTGLSTFMNHQDHPCPGSNLRFLYYCIMWTSSHMYCGLQFTRWEFIKFPPGFFQVAIGSWSLYHPCNLTTQIIRLDGQKPATCMPIIGLSFRVPIFVQPSWLQFCILVIKTERYPSWHSLTWDRRKYERVGEQIFWHILNTHKHSGGTRPQPRSPSLLSAYPGL